MLRAILGLLALALVVVTLLPLRDSGAWWIRGWEFPRLHIFALAVVIGVVAAVVLTGTWRGAIVLSMVAVIGWQGSWLWRYLPGMPVAVPQVAGEGGVGIMALNVLQENEDHDAVRALIREEDPDVLLLMEVDQVWADALSEELARYDTRREEIRDDHYGMIFATRVPVESAELRQLEGTDVPIATAVLTTSDGPLLVTGLHPRPPVPGNSTDDRDRQLAAMATLMRRVDMPAVAVGDFNDVPFSRRGSRLREAGGLKDTREGRGLMTTFDVTHPILRFPIDQALVTEDVILHDKRLGPEVGSDHLPLLLRVRAGP
ncbi:endonuclease/exonuclease/phosphatase family protein [Jannaschia sp. KMU-145]|uniref:endonuclease/exonuclease/phosphatase family protein n=1 Tax=Jannaschia halovivens TaxID=3388667 RepID=UPI00396B4465